MNGKRTTLPQQVLDKALRSIARISPKSSLTSSAALGMEYGIPPIEAMVAAARTRARKKFPTRRTVIADLIANPPATRKRTWVSGTNMWLQTRGGAAKHVIDPSEAASIVKNDTWDRYNNINGGQSGRFFMYFNFAATNQFLKYATCNPSVASGIEYLSSIRLSIFRGTQYLARTGCIPPEFINRCPFCEAEVGETPKHLLLECRLWSFQRLVYLQATIDLFDPQWFQLLGGQPMQIFWIL